MQTDRWRQSQELTYSLAWPPDYDMGPRFTKYEGIFICYPNKHKEQNYLKSKAVFNLPVYL
jgi:hypothetical protein